MRSDADWLGDILSAVAKIKERISDSFAAFQGDAVKDRHLIKDWPGINILDAKVGQAPIAVNPVIEEPLQVALAPLFQKTLKV